MAVMIVITKWKYSMILLLILLMHQISVIVLMRMVIIANRVSGNDAFYHYDCMIAIRFILNYCQSPISFHMIAGCLHQYLTSSVQYFSI